MGNSMKTYSLMHILDLVRIPPDRLNTCLAEIRQFIIEAREAMGGNIPDNLECPEGFEWVDEGF